MSETIPAACPCNPPNNPYFQWQNEPVYLRFPMSNGNDFELKLRRRVSKADFERLKQLIDLAEESIVQTNIEGTVQ